MYVVEWDLRKFSALDFSVRHAVASTAAHCNGFLRRDEFMVRMNRVYDSWWVMGSDVWNVAVNIGSGAEM
jgi:hypothetical protein